MVQKLIELFIGRGWVVTPQASAGCVQILSVDQNKSDVSLASVYGAISKMLMDEAAAAERSPAFLPRMTHDAKKAIFELEDGNKIELWASPDDTESAIIVRFSTLNAA